MKGGVGSRPTSLTRLGGFRCDVLAELRTNATRLGYEYATPTAFAGTDTRPRVEDDELTSVECIVLAVRANPGEEE